ncbi:MAG: NADPH-dependent FMN reductase [Bacillota bacterium]
MQIFAVSGSLRAESTNTLVLKAVAELIADSSIHFYQYGDLGLLPHFNPDLDNEHPPEMVVQLRSALKLSDALLVCSPEYIHGIPGSLKNAFDWLASSGELDGMPVGIINATPSHDGATFAQQALQEVLTVLSNNIVPEAVIRIGAVKTKIDPHGKITDPELTKKLRTALQSLTEAKFLRSC